MKSEGKQCPLLFSLHQISYILNIKSTLINSVTNNPYAKNAATGAYFYDAAPESDQVFSAKVTTDLSVTYRPVPAIAVTAGANNLFDVYPDQLYIDPRNSLNSVYASPVVTTSLGTTKAVGVITPPGMPAAAGASCMAPTSLALTGDTFMRN